MALLDEEVVEYWLNNNGFFCMRGVKTGLGEIDFLAIRPNENGLECWQVEVSQECYRQCCKRCLSLGSPSQTTE